MKNYLDARIKINEERFKETKNIFYQGCLSEHETMKNYLNDLPLEDFVLMFVQKESQCTKEDHIKCSQYLRGELKNMDHGWKYTLLARMQELLFDHRANKMATGTNE